MEVCKLVFQPRKSISLVKEKNVLEKSRRKSVVVVVVSNSKMVFSF